MAMTPQELERMNRLEKLVESLVRVENVPFIENIGRRAGTGVMSDTISANTTILKNVNEGGVAVYNVAKVPDGKLQIKLSTGEIKFIGIYNS